MEHFYNIFAKDIFSYIKMKNYCEIKFCWYKNGKISRKTSLWMTDFKYFFET